jgi:5'-3' exonuclease
MYAPYKKNRVVDEKSQTEAEIEENRMFWQTYESLTDYFKDRTNITVLRHEEAEADDMIARFLHMHPEDTNYIVSTDQDYIQCLNERVHIFNGVEGHRISLDGYWKENGKPVIDKKTKVQKVLEGTPEYLLWRKICRGDSSDNIFPAYPGVREKGTKNKVGIKEAFEDRDKMGFAYNNFMLQKFVDHEGLEHRVREDFQRNRALIDLTAQPEDMKQKFDQRIRESVRVTTTPQVGVHFLRFCGKYKLEKLSQNAETFSKWLNAPYTGNLV